MWYEDRIDKAKNDEFKAGCTWEKRCENQSTQPHPPTVLHPDDGPREEQPKGKLGSSADKNEAAPPFVINVDVDLPEPQKREGQAKAQPGSSASASGEKRGMPMPPAKAPDIVERAKITQVHGESEREEVVMMDEDETKSVTAAESTQAVAIPQRDEAPQDITSHKDIPRGTVTSVAKRFSKVREEKTPAMKLEEERGKTLLLNGLWGVSIAIVDPPNPPGGASSKEVRILPTFMIPVLLNSFPLLLQ